MANTTNYNWETPDDTDLVKDGAAAIRTLGSSIDTTTKNLNPETTLGDIAYRSATANTNTRLAVGSNGQVLTVASGVPSWATPTTGDIEGVTAGTGISGGGTSGTVTITNSMATAIDAKGDLVVGTGADTFSRLAVGANGTTLVADSAEATGLKWAAPAGGGSFDGVRLFDTGIQNISNATNTAINFNSESFDTNSYHSTSTNTSRITIPTTGYYRFQGTIFVDANASGGRYLEIQKNGTGVSAFEIGASTQASVATSLPFHGIFLATAGDYFQLFLYQNSGGTRNTYTAGTAYNQFSAQFLGA